MQTNMENEFDVNKIASNFLESQIKDFFKAGGDLIKKGNDELSLTFKTKYKKYLVAITDRFCKTKSFFIGLNSKLNGNLNKQSYKNKPEYFEYKRVQISRFLSVSKK